MTTCTFDKHNIERLIALYRLQYECFRLGDSLIHDFDPPNIPTSNYFYKVIDIVKPAFVFLANDEVTTQLENRGALPDLLAEIVSNMDNLNIEILKRVNDEINRTYVYDVNFLIGSIFLDLTVNIFSVFENSIELIYRFLRTPEDERNSKLNKIKKYIEKYNKMKHVCNEDEQIKILNNILRDCSGYTSGKEKIDYVFSKLNKNKYSRVIENDKKLVSFLHLCRNTVHNGGNYQGKANFKITFGGETFELIKGRPLNSPSHVLEVQMYEELGQIYYEILKNLEICESQYIYVT